MRSRRIVVALVTLLMGLTGCSPPDVTAIQVEDRGLPQVINCGRWLEAVQVSDADTGRVIWAARAGERDGSDASATISLGELPVPSWAEQAPLAVDPRPSTWQFDVTASGHAVIVVPDAELRPGRVHRRDGSDESRSHYDEQTCTGIPVSRRVVGLGLAGVVACGIALALIARTLRRRQPVSRAR